MATEFNLDKLSEEFALLFPTHKNGFYVREGGECPFIDRPLTVEDYRRHLAGEQEIVVVPIQDNGCTTWGAIDDDHKNELGEKVPYTDAELAEICQRVATLGLPLIVAPSRSRGVHFYLFLAQRLHASITIRMLARYRETLGLPPRTELFPKQAEIEKAGNGIALPYFDMLRTTRRSVRTPEGSPLALRAFLDRLPADTTHLIRLLGLDRTEQTSSKEKKTITLTREELQRRVNRKVLEVLEAKERNTAVHQLTCECRRAALGRIAAGEQPSAVYREYEQLIRRVGRAVDDRADKLTAEEVQSIIKRELRKEDAADDVTLELADWRKAFHHGHELAEGELKMYIRGFLPEGITFLGSLSGVGKTWLALSMSKALTTGRPFLGVYEVLETLPVLYLVPEMGQRAFRNRLEKFGLVNNDKFFCQTLSDGVMSLEDSRLQTAVTELKPVVFIDTAIRFNRAKDENQARENSALLAQDLFRLIKWGAVSVVGLHHSPKSQSETEFMTLENVLRGTGDIGAMCDAVWGMQHDRRKNGRKQDYAYLKESQEKTRLYLRCVKPRDFEPAEPFCVQGRPYIDEKGDLAVITADSREEKIDNLLKADPQMSLRGLARGLGLAEANTKAVKDMAEGRGWVRENGIWQQVI